MLLQRIPDDRSDKSKKMGALTGALRVACSMILVQNDQLVGVRTAKLHAQEVHSAG